MMINLRTVIRDDTWLIVDNIKQYNTVLDYLFDNNLFPENIYSKSQYNTYIENKTFFEFMKDKDYFYIPCSKENKKFFTEYHFNDIVEFQNNKENIQFNFDIL